jgi:hypothetical protein
MTNLKQMREFVRQELVHIPDSPYPQGELRLAYWRLRMHSLGRKGSRNKTPKEILEESLAIVRPDYPDFEFEYDTLFFGRVTQKPKHKK